MSDKIIGQDRTILELRNCSPEVAHLCQSFAIAILEAELKTIKPSDLRAYSATMIRNYLAGVIGKVKAMTYELPNGEA